MMVRFIICYFVLLLVVKSSAQGVAIGEWRDHLPYNQCVAVAKVGDRIYCATNVALFYYSLEDNSINRLSKINGLSDIGISTIAYHDKTKALIVAYSNTNIDLLVNNKIVNIADIKRKTILGNKTINNVYCAGDYAYLSCGFGIVVLDLVRKEIKDTYYIGNNSSPVNVLDIIADDSTLYAATDKGLYYARLKASNLADYRSWQVDLSIPKPYSKFNSVVLFNNRLMINKSGTKYNTDTVFIRTNNTWDYWDTVKTATRHELANFGDLLYMVNAESVEIYDQDFQRLHVIYDYLVAVPEPRSVLADGSAIWIADYRSGLVKNYNTWKYEVIRPQGPASIDVFELNAMGGEIWVASGGKDASMGNNWNKNGTYSFIDEKWTNQKSQTAVFDSLYDIVTVAVNPHNNAQVFAGSWGGGLVEFSDNQAVNVYDDQNSSLKSYEGFHWIGVGGLAFDESNNLWVSHSDVFTVLLSVKKPNGEWVSFDLGATTKSKAASTLIIDNYNQKWMKVARDQGIAVFSDGGTLDNKGDDQYLYLTNESGQGSLPSNGVKCLVKDQDGEIWVGTDKGIAVFYSPENVFSGKAFDAEQILVEQDGYAQYLLESEIVTCIAVDGANKKWIGTENAGVFFLSEDGTEQIHHFTTDNSPLFTNDILDIAINGVTGEVFFGTSIGILSYKGMATEPVEEFVKDDVYAYPNPVREYYNGNIAIKGLVRDSDIKITDISGNLVYKTRSEGGQAIWNGKNLTGHRAQSGVYLVFVANEDGSEKIVTKILFIN